LINKINNKTIMGNYNKCGCLSDKNQISLEKEEEQVK
jgi:hypothetical protein